MRMCCLLQMAVLGSVEISATISIQSPYIADRFVSSFAQYIQDYVGHKVKKKMNTNMLMGQYKPSVRCLLLEKK